VAGPWKPNSSMLPSPPQYGTARSRWTAPRNCLFSKTLRDVALSLKRIAPALNGGPFRGRVPPVDHIFNSRPGNRRALRNASNGGAGSIRQQRRCRSASRVGRTECRPGSTAAVWGESSERRLLARSCCLRAGGPRCPPPPYLADRTTSANGRNGARPADLSVGAQ